MNKTFLLVLIAGLCGGSIYPLIKIADSYNIPKFSYIFWESVFVIILFSFGSFVTRNRRYFQKEKINYYGFCALTNILIPQFLFFIVASKVPASIISVIIVITPFLVYLTSYFFLKEKLVVRKLLGVLLGLVGILILFLPEIKQENGLLGWYWIAFSLLIPIDYTINRIYASKLIDDIDDPYSLSIGLFAIVALVSVFMSLVSEEFYVPFTSFSYGDLVIIAHAVLMAIFYFIFFTLAKDSALKNSLSFYIAPLVGMGWGFVFFQEQVSSFLLISTILVFSGLYLLNKK